MIFIYVFVQNRAFIHGIFDLECYFDQDPEIKTMLKRISHILKELMQYNSMLIDQMNRAVSSNLSTFLKNDIHKVKETKRVFDKVGEEHDNAIVKNSQCAKTRPLECEEVKNILESNRKCFQYTALDYICQMSCIQSKKRHELLDSVSY